jgi:hypothetical protein
MRSFHIFAAIILIVTPLVVVGAKNVNRGHDDIYGYESVEQYGLIPGNTGGEIVEARCTEGRKVLGGGYNLVSGGGWLVQGLGPSPDGGGYYLAIGSTDAEPQEVIVTAICAFVSKRK